MNAKKPIRKYGVVRRVLMLSRYYVQKGVVMPCSVGAFIVTAVMSGVLLSLGVSLLFSGLLWFLFPGWFRAEEHFLTIWVPCMFLMACVGSPFLEACADRLTQMPPGHFLNPARPDTNAVLPDAETLIRAAMPDHAAQKATLLRAALETPDTKHETLLRPVSSAPENRAAEK